MALKLHPYKNKPPMPVGSRWVYLMGGDGTNGPEFAWKDLCELTSDLKKDARLSLDKLKAGWDTGQKLEDLFDPKLCHDVHKFNHLSKAWTIFSFRRTKRDVLRLYFIYGPPPPNGMLVVISIDTKDQQQLTAQQKSNLEDTAKILINFQTQENVKLINSTSR